MESLATGEVLFSHNADKLLIPASNTKLFTGALALDRLGPSFRIRTSVFAKEPPTSRGTIQGDLVLYGRGDPMFAARYFQEDFDRSLSPLVKAIRAAGVKRIEGSLVGDETYFHTPAAGTGWDWDDLQYYYGAVASALTIEENVVDLVIQPGSVAGLPCVIQPFPPTSHLTFINRTTTGPVDSEARIRVHRPLGESLVYVAGQLPLGGKPDKDAVTMLRPAPVFLERLRGGLEAKEIEVEGSMDRVVSWPAAQGAITNGLVEIAHVDSPPMLEIVRGMMKRSQNLYAQLLLLQVGAQREARSEAGQGGGVTEALGLAEMADFLEPIGIGRTDYRLQEGAGLSRGDLIKPSVITKLLRHMRGHPHWDLFRSTLPVAGIDGSLIRRMQDTAAAGNVRAKTGTLTGVYTLSGYVTTSAGEELAFSLMLNNYRPADTEANPRAALDAIAVIIAESGAPEEKQPE